MAPKTVLRTRKVVNKYLTLEDKTKISHTCFFNPNEIMRAMNEDGSTPGFLSWSQMCLLPWPVD